VVGRPKEDRTRRFSQIARRIAEGHFQDAIAQELNMHKSAVQRAVREMRAELAGAFDDPRWNDPSKTSAVQIARAWLERHPRDAEESDREKSGP